MHVRIGKTSQIIISSADIVRDTWLKRL